MTSTVPGISDAPTKHEELIAWVKEIADLTTPKRVVWVDGSQEEWDRLTEQLVSSGAAVKLNEEKKPNSFLANSDPADVARVESRTYICSEKEEDAGPTNNWAPPAAMKEEMTEHYKGAMKGRTMYVIPFVMGHLEAENPMFGVEITDSEYVVASMRVMARCGTKILKRIEELGENAKYVPALHSLGAPLAEDTPREVFLFVISGHKEANPAAAQELIARLS